MNLFMFVVWVINFVVAIIIGDAAYSVVALVGMHYSFNELKNYG